MARRRKGFDQLAALDPRRLGLPARRATDLLLQSGWLEVAGEFVARHAPAVSVRRGVLEIRRPVAPWAATLEPELPALAVRLALLRPRLGIKRLRVRGTDATRTAAIDLDLVRSPDELPSARDPARVVQPAPHPAGERAVQPESDRLQRLRDRYLGAARDRQKA